MASSYDEEPHQASSHIANIPNRSILDVQFRRTTPVSLSSAIKQYISNKYDQHPDMFKADLDLIDRLRTDAVSVHEPHPGGIPRIEAYAAQLVWLGGKFPIDIGADFAWFSSLSYNQTTPVSQNNIRFELANVLFNLAVLYCQLANSSNRSTSDGLKTASNYFCQAAGVISHLKTNALTDLQSAPPEDMDPLTLECLEQLFLAQAQECFWQKAVKDGMKDAVIAKLAARVSDLYLAASDWAIKSDVIASEWIHHMSAKHHHFAAAAQYRAACDCLEKRKYGEEVARLRDSLACATEGLKESRYISKIVADDLTALKFKVQDDLKRAEKDNDMIYLQPAPPKSELKVLDRANMVSPRITKAVSDPISQLGDNAPLGKPLFTKLVPYSVHVAASIYDNRKDQVIHSIIEDIEALNNRIHDLLRSLNLPGSLQALEKPLGLPPGLESHAEEIRQQNGPDRIKKSLNDINKIRSNNKSTFAEAVKLLQSEAADDDAARRKYGTDRWRRVSSEQAGAKMHEKIAQFEGWFKDAESSDKAVMNKIDENAALIDKLNGTDRDLEEYVPSSRRATSSAQVEREIRRVREVLNQVNRLEARRKRRSESLKAKGQSDDVHPEIIKEAHRLERLHPMSKLEAVQFEDFFDQRLTRYNVDRAIPKEEEREQQALLSALAEANTSLITARRGDSSTKDRERALQKLENAYYSYKEIIQNLDVGRRFYNDLAPLVANYRNECRNYAYQRRGEATHLESDIVTSLPVSQLRVSSPKQAQTPLQARKAPMPSEGSPHKWTPNQRHMYKEVPARMESPLAAPQPVKPTGPPAAVMEAETALEAGAPSGASSSVWGPEMGIKFGGAPKGEGEGAVDGRWDASRGLKFG